MHMEITCFHQIYVRNLTKRNHTFWIWGKKSTNKAQYSIDTRMQVKRTTNTSSSWWMVGDNFTLFQFLNFTVLILKFRTQMIVSLLPSQSLVNPLLKARNKVEYVMCVCGWSAACQGKVELFWFRLMWVFSFGHFIWHTSRGVVTVLDSIGCFWWGHRRHYSKWARNTEGGPRPGLMISLKIQILSVFCFCIPWEIAFVFESTSQNNQKSTEHDLKTCQLDVFSYFLKFLNS